MSVRELFLRLGARWRAGEWTVAALVSITVFFSCAWFFQGGGANQNAHLATVLALVEDGSLNLDKYRGMTGDIARVKNHVVSAKPIATALVAIPGYMVARAVTAPVKNLGNRFILRGYLTSLFASGLALALMAAVFYHLFRRRLPPVDAAFLALAMTLATPFFPNATMLTSHPLASLCALAAFSMLEKGRARIARPSTWMLCAAGAATGLAVCFEYQSALVVPPLAAYASHVSRSYRQFAWFVLGGLVVAVIPAWHHTHLYGSPFRTGYAALVNEGFARDAARGFMGFVPSEFSLFRLYNLTFGSLRGFFFLSPFLVAAIPGWVRMLRDRRSRPEGLTTLVAAWTVVLMVSTLVYWHSGSATGSRYALLFVAFCGPAVAAAWRGRRVWVVVGVVPAFIIMAMSTSVSGMPPGAPQNPPYDNVVYWWWEHFAKGDLSFWRGTVISIEGVGEGNPTLPQAFNLGQLMGIKGLSSLIPYLATLGLSCLAVWRAARRLDPNTPGR